MNKTLLVAIVALAFPAAVGFAADQEGSVPTSLRTGFQRIRASDLKANLNFLASDALLGRMSLQAGDDSAAQWVAAEFAPSVMRPKRAMAGDSCDSVMR
jgi:hypothetical protein